MGRSRRQFPDTGWDWALTRAVADHDAHRQPTVQCALSIPVAAEHRRHGISAAMVQAMKAIGRADGLAMLLAPVRPSLKHRYPLTSIERYICWTDGASLPFDPWMRVHARLGGVIVGACSRSMEIVGTIAEWEAWTGMRFVESGTYVGHEALVPVTIDHVADRGTYVEPNVWMRHAIAESRPGSRS